MITASARLLDRLFGLPIEQGEPIVLRVITVLAAAMFLLIATVTLAFNSIFGEETNIAALQINDVSPVNIYAPETISFESDVLTQQRREDARNAVPPVYTPPDVNVSRAQTALAARILDFIANVRADPYGSPTHRASDLRAINALTLGDDITDTILQADDKSWTDIESEIRALVEQVMQESIRESDLPGIIDRLPNMVSLRFSDQQSETIVAVVRDLIRPNRTVNVEATDSARERAASEVPPQSVSFQRGQIVVGSGQPITPVVYESLTKMGLLQPTNLRLQHILRAFLASALTMTMFGMYLARFRPDILYRQPRLLVLLAVIFLIVLIGARISIAGEFYLFTAGLIGLLFAATTSPHVAIIGTIGLAFLVSLIANNSLEAAAIITVAGITGVLTLRRPDRLPSYFAAGLFMSLAVAFVALIFALNSGADINGPQLAAKLIYALLSGIVTAAATIVGLYLLGQVFNIATAVRLIELSQPQQPLLQRLLREAPGTYQHSLHVANLGEQAAGAIGANAGLVYVGALYHDIGKMLNPAFFVENQSDAGHSPHDALDDPYVSAQIIIDHIIGGAEMARKYRLPNRIRDFILEHHGTTVVYVFYQKALAQASRHDQPEAVDKAAFRYPGPKPRTRETGILMLADSCEASVRAAQPETREAIEGLVDNIFDQKLKDGQLDECDLTIQDLNTIREVFVDILKAMFHPRINYEEAVTVARRGLSEGQSPLEPITNPRPQGREGGIHSLPSDPRTNL